MSKITVGIVLISGLVLGTLASIHAHAAVIQTSARDSSTGPFNPNLPAEARTRSGFIGSNAKAKAAPNEGRPST